MCRSILRAHEFIFKKSVFKKQAFTFKSSSDLYKITTFWSVDNQFFHRSETIKKKCPALSFIILETYIVKASIILTSKTELLVLFFHQEFACQRAKYKCLPLSSHHPSLNCLPTAFLTKTYAFFPFHLYK